MSEGTSANRMPTASNMTKEQLLKVLSETVKKLRMVEAKRKEVSEQVESWKERCDIAEAKSSELEEINRKDRNAWMEVTSSFGQVSLLLDKYESHENSDAGFDRTIELMDQEFQTVKTLQEDILRCYDAEQVEAIVRSKGFQPPMGDTTCSKDQMLSDYQKEIEECRLEIKTLRDEREQDLQRVRAMTIEEMNTKHAKGLEQAVEGPSGGSEGTGLSQPTLIDENVKELQEEIERLKGEIQVSKKKFLAIAKKKQGEFEAKLRQVEMDNVSLGGQVARLEAELETSKTEASAAVARARAAEADRDAAYASTVVEQSSAVEEMDSQLQEELEEELADLRKKLASRENALSESRVLLEQEQSRLRDLTASMQEQQAQSQAMLISLNEKLSEAESKLSSSVSTLQADLEESKSKAELLEKQLVEKEQALATVEGTVGGEAARLRAALEAAKSDLHRLTEEQEGERKRVKLAFGEMKKKLEREEASRLACEEKLLELQETIESGKKANIQDQAAKGRELEEAMDKIKRAEEDLRDYKARAGAMLRKKDEDLKRALEGTVGQGTEEALEFAQEHAANLEGQLANLKVELEEKDVELRSLHTRLEEERLRRKSTDEKLANKDYNIAAIRTSIESEWKEKFKEFEASKESVQGKRLLEAHEVADALKKQNMQLQDKVALLDAKFSEVQEEFSSFQTIAKSLQESKDVEITKLQDEVNRLTMQLSSLQDKLPRRRSYGASSSATSNALAGLSIGQEWGSEKYVGSNFQEDRLFEIAQVQAQRDTVLHAYEEQIKALENEISDLQQEVELRDKQEAVLKETIRDWERDEKRSNVDLKYLKNVCVKLLETGQEEALAPVIAMILQFSPDELKRCMVAVQGRHAGEMTPTEVAPAVTSMASEVAGSASLWLSSFWNGTSTAEGTSAALPRAL